MPGRDRDLNSARAAELFPRRRTFVLLARAASHTLLGPLPAVQSACARCATSSCSSAAATALAASSKYHPNMCTHPPQPAHPGGTPHASCRTPTLAQRTAEGRKKGRRETHETPSARRSTTSPRPAIVANPNAAADPAWVVVLRLVRSGGSDGSGPWAVRMMADEAGEGS